MFRNVMLSLVMLAASTLGSAYGEEKKAEAPPKPAHRVVVYYLHNTWRCPGCDSVESLSRAAVMGGKGENSKAGTTIEVTTPFAAEVKSGLVTFQSVNIDKKENKELLKTLGNNLKVPVFVEMKNGKITSFVPMTEAWSHLGDNEAFVKYVQDGAKPLLKKVKPTKTDGDKNTAEKE